MVLFLYHFIVGIGCPSAIQYKNNLVPTVTVCGESAGSSSTLGASVEKNRNYTEIIVWLPAATTTNTNSKQTNVMIN